LINFLHTNDFFTENYVDFLFNSTNDLLFIQKDYGEEIEDFNMIIPDLDPVFSKLLANDVTVVKETSGVFRKPNIGVHFESFSDLSEWVFIIALQKTTFNIYHHSSGAKTALEDYRFDYKNSDDWNLHSTIMVEPNQGIIFKPWLFHSLDPSLVQVYRLKGK